MLAIFCQYWLEYSSGVLSVVAFQPTLAYIRLNLAKKWIRSAIERFNRWSMYPTQVRLISIQRDNYVQWNVSSTTINYCFTKGGILEKVMCLESSSEKHYQHQRPTLVLISIQAAGFM